MKKSLLQCLFIGLSFLSATAIARPCPFCNPEVIQNQSVARGKNAHIIYNYKPAHHGHLMLIPKRHITHFSDLSIEEMQEIQTLIQNINRIYLAHLNYDNFFIIQKNGDRTGRSEEHVHFHTIPITDDYRKTLRINFDMEGDRKKLSTVELDKVVQEFSGYYQQTIKDE